MSFQLLNIGQAANDGTGDELRTAFNKINQNLEFLYSKLVIDYLAPLPENFLPDILIITGTNVILTDMSPIPITVLPDYYPFYFSLELQSAHENFSLTLSNPFASWEASALTPHPQLKAFSDIIFNSSITWCSPATTIPNIFNLIGNDITYPITINFKVGFKKPL